MMKGLSYIITLAISFLFISCSNGQTPPESEKGATKYMQARAAFKTVLTKKMKAPQDFSDFDSLKGAIKLVYYVSNNDSLKGLLETTNIEATKKKPAVVYLHGGFSLGYEDVNDCKPFIKNGFVVFAPSYRGENGNPGNYEFFMGEVEDAKAAIRWLSEQPYVDKDNIYVFGHSIGGGMSLLLSLHNDIPIKASASCAGIYVKASVEVRAEDDEIPYDITIDAENIYRLPVYTLNSMVREHTMYIGTEDNYSEYEKFVKALYPQKTLKLQLIEVKGNHYGSLKPSMEAFIKGIKKK